jgi:hypothetical protein
MEILKNLRNIGYFSLENHGNGMENWLSAGISLNDPFQGFELSEIWLFIHVLGLNGVESC